MTLVLAVLAVAVLGTATVHLALAQAGLALAIAVRQVHLALGTNMIIIEILLAVGVIGLVVMAFYGGYRIGKANDEINSEANNGNSKTSK